MHTFSPSLDGILQINYGARCDSYSFPGGERTVVNDPWATGSRYRDTADAYVSDFHLSAAPIPANAVAPQAPQVHGLFVGVMRRLLIQVDVG